jgi:hypothetical protein
MTTNATASAAPAICQVIVKVSGRQPSVPEKLQAL